MPTSSRRRRASWARRHVHSAVVDIADLGQVEAATQTTLRDSARIDILVANAGLTGPNAPLWDYPATPGGR